MVKKTILAVLAALLMQTFAISQTEMAVPYGSFEQWTSHSGYSIGPSFLGLTVYSSYSTPTGWDYLTYPVNQTVSFYTINTNLPLIKAGQETGAVPDGSSAVKLQTFMLSDIIGSAVYSMASSSLDPTLTTEVYPSILSTGVADIDHFIPIMNSMIGNMDNTAALLASLVNLDINYIITGGIPLGTFEPSYLSGSYKYHSAVSGDNGGVVLLGTRYNSTLHKREVVGGGANIALTDCNGYTPFTVEYMSLHEYDASYAEQTPDSLIIMLVSSASTNRQQGSYLCIDNLSLWHVDPPDPEPDTCAHITNLSAIADIHEATLSWGTTDAVDGFELEYGIEDFVQGQGTTVVPDGNSHSLSNLAADTQYKVYLRSTCTNGAYGDWSTITFTTLPDTCAHITNLSATADIHEATLSWGTTAAVGGFELEYGIGDFVQGQGTTVVQDSNNLSFSSLAADTQYKVYLRSSCTNGAYGDWSTITFTTLPDTCAGIYGLSAEATIHEVMLFWNIVPTAEGFELEYGPIGFEEGQGTTVSLNNGTGEQPRSHYRLRYLDANTEYEARLRTSCDNDTYSGWATVTFTTLQDTCTSVYDLAVIATPGIPSAYYLMWEGSSEPESWEVEYGTQGFTLGSGTMVTLEEASMNLSALELQADSWYDFYVRSVCNDGVYGEWNMTSFHTDTVPDTNTNVSIAKPDHSPSTSHLSIYPNPAHGQCTVALTDIREAELRLYTADGRMVQKMECKRSDDSTFTLQLPYFGVFLLQVVTHDGTRAHKIVNRP